MDDHFDKNTKSVRGYRLIPDPKKNLINFLSNLSLRFCQTLSRFSTIPHRPRQHLRIGKPIYIGDSLSNTSRLFQDISLLSFEV